MRVHNSYILLVDDDYISLTILNAFINDAGYKTQSAHDLSEVLSLITTDPPIMIICDQNLTPGSDKGMEIILKLRAISAVVSIPIVLSSASDLVLSPDLKKDLHLRISKKPITPGKVREWLSVLPPPKRSGTIKKIPDSMMKKLSDDYLIRLTIRLSEIAELFLSASKDVESYQSLGREIHRLGGTGPSYGIHWVLPLCQLIEKRVFEGKCQFPFDIQVSDLGFQLFSSLSKLPVEELRNIELKNVFGFRQLENLLKE